jgi:iron complex transport system substrate-binding protein
VWFLLLCLLFPLTASGYDRVISLSPQLTESIYLLKAENSLAAVTSLCKRPGDAMRKEKIGTPLRPDIEKIVAMKPDLILASREGNPPWTVVRLKRLGFTVHYFARPKTLAQLFANFTDLATILNREENGRVLVSGVAAALGNPEGTPRGRVLWQVGAEPLIAASTASFANDVIRLAGGKNVVDTEMPYPRINAEEAVLKGPDVIVLMDMGYNVDREMGRWRKFLKSTKFVVMDAYTVGSPTPLSFLEAVRKLGAVMPGK